MELKATGNLSTSTEVLGTPLNKFVLIKPGKNKVSLLGKTILPTTKLAAVIPSGNSRGRKGEEGHCGIIRVPLAL